MKTPDFSNLSNTFKGLRLSLLEIVALVSTLVFAAIVLAIYFNSIQPIKNKITELEMRKKQLTTQATTQKAQDEAVTNQRVNAQKILDSLGSFEARLRHRKQGIPDVINEVNQLAKAYRVRAGDIRFQTASADQLAVSGQAGAVPTPTPAITRRDKLPNVYEGLGIDTTVEGDYHDLRRFISALERSRNFVIVNAISLQSIDEKNKQRASLEGAENIPGQPPMARAGVPNNAVPAPNSFPTKVTVSLKIEMETHFAREGAIDTTLAKPIPAVAPPVTK